MVLNSLGLITEFLENLKRSLEETTQSELKPMLPQLHEFVMSCLGEFESSAKHKFQAIVQDSIAKMAQGFEANFFGSVLENYGSYEFDIDESAYQEYEESLERWSIAKMVLAKLSPGLDEWSVRLSETQFSSLLEVLFGIVCRETHSLI